MVILAECISCQQEFLMSSQTIGVVMEVTFEGIPSGDYECFCWDVDRETFIRVTGREPESYDESSFHEGLYMLYPSTAMGLFDKKHKLGFTLQVEEGLSNCARCGTVVLSSDALCSTCVVEDS